MCHSHGFNFHLYSHDKCLIFFFFSGKALLGTLLQQGCTWLNSQYAVLLLLWMKCKYFKNAIERALYLFISQRINEKFISQGQQYSEQRISLIKGHFILIWRFHIHKNATAIDNGNHNHVGRMCGKRLFFLSWAEDKLRIIQWYICKTELYTQGSL